MWQPPSLTLVWPAFFRLDMTEESQTVMTASMALKSNMITRRMALEKLRSIYPFENIEAVLEQLEEEAEQNAEHEIENLLSKAMSGESDAEKEESGNGDGDGGDDGDVDKRARAVQNEEVSARG